MEMLTLDGIYRTAQIVSLKSKGMETAAFGTADSAHTVA